MGPVQTFIRKLITWVQVHDLAFRHYKPGWNVLLTLTVDSPFCSNIRHSNEGQLKAVKLEHPLAVITWLYHGLIFLPIEVTFFLFSSNILFDHGLYPSQKILQSRDRTPTAWPSVPQAYQCLISHFLATIVWEPVACYCTSMWPSMLWSVDSCQNSVSTDHYRLTVSRAQV